MTQRSSVVPRWNSPTPLLVITTVLMLAVAGVLLAVLLTRRNPPSGGVQLDVGAAQAGVEQVLTDPINGYGREGVSDVACNGGRNPIVKKGTGFSCTVLVEGAPRQVAVEFTDDAGTYEVDRPR